MLSLISFKYLQRAAVNGDAADRKDQITQLQSVVDELC